MKKLLLITSIALLFMGFSKAQENPFRMDLKLGQSDVLSFNFEYVTPFLSGKLAPVIGVSYSPSSSTYSMGIRTSIEIGSNYYLFKPGKGLYGHVSYSHSKFKNININGEGNSVFSASSRNNINFRLGAKWGNRFYIRPEIGYGLRFNYLSYETISSPITYESTTTYRDFRALDWDNIQLKIGVGIAF